MSVNNRVKFVAMVVLCQAVLAAIVDGIVRFSMTLFGLAAIFIFVAIAAVTVPDQYYSPWESRIRVVVGAALVVFTGLMIRQLLTIIP